MLHNGRLLAATNRRAPFPFRALLSPVQLGSAKVHSIGCQVHKTYRLLCHLRVPYLFPPTQNSRSSGAGRRLPVVAGRLMCQPFGGARSITILFFHHPPLANHIADGFQFSTRSTTGIVDWELRDLRYGPIPLHCQCRQTPVVERVFRHRTAIVRTRPPYGTPPRTLILPGTSVAAACCREATTSAS